ncbi:MAG: leucine-rich repeat domain-containing protein [Butyribacter sp.]|nr:leucine-rich repeat domain-containing protein [bacterium]MDY3854952.1 leucine-rich repeat domain-containing protein [Butyribacter sp.]
MKKGKWIVKSIVTFLVILMGTAVSVNAETNEAADDNHSNTYSYYLDSDNGCLTITGNGTMGNVGIDTKQKGYKFVSNRPWALTKARARKIKVVNIGEGITTVPAGAFANLPNLKKVQMSDTVTSIGKYAFYGCKSLKTIHLSKNVKTIGSEAFYNCSKITSIALGSKVAKIGNRTFFGTKALCSIKVDKANKNFVVKEDGLYSKSKRTLYCYATGISGSAKILKTTVRIKSGAFAYAKFSKIAIPAAVRVIESGAFYHCKKLKKVTFAPKSKCKAFLCYYKNYGDHVKERLGTFEGCSSLVTFHTPDRLRFMGSSTFVECKKLKEVTLGKSFRYFLTDKNKKTKNIRKTSLKKVTVKTSNKK